MHAKHLLIALAMLTGACNLQDPETALELPETTASVCDPDVDAACDKGEGVPPPDMRQDMRQETSPDMRACIPEDVAAFCERYHVQCGVANGLDNCETARAGVDCGSCPDGGVCEQHQCVACAPESDEDFCTRFGRSCGSAHGFDNCGELREVADCGTCMAPEICDEFTAMCGCPRESDAQFCERHGANCGELTGRDSCDQLRTVASCGPCKSGECVGQICSVCQPRPLGQLCEIAGANCGVLHAVECGVDVSGLCGTCGAEEACMAMRCACPTPSCPASVECGLILNTCGESIDCGECAPTESCQDHVCQEK